MRARLLLVALLALAGPARADWYILPGVSGDWLPIDPYTTTDVCFNREHPRDDVVAHAICPPVGDVDAQVHGALPDVPENPPIP